MVRQTVASSSHRLSMETLESRDLLSWAGTPPTLITVPTSATAITLNSNAQASGAASITANENDYLTFTAPRSGSYRIDVSTPNSDLDSVLGIFNNSGQRLAYNDDIAWPTNRDSRITLNLSAGQRYFVGITNYTGTVGGAYNWSIIGPSATITDDAFEDNDSLTIARNLGTISGSRSWSNLVLADTADWYRFTTTDTGTLNHSVRIDFAHSAGNLELQLYNSSGTLMNTSETTGNAEAFRLNDRPAGTYFLRVYGANGARNPNYSLSIVAPTTVAPVDDAYEQNDSLATARDLGRITAPRTLSNLIMADTGDWFRFNTAISSSNGTIAVQSSQSGDLDMQLYNAAGTLIGTSDSPTANESISLANQAAGTYFVRVYGYNGARNSNYSLTITPPTAVSPPPAGSGDRILYLDVDGAFLSRSDLIRWAGNDWASSVNEFDPDGNGINVAPFLNGRTDRQQVIARMVQLMQDDLNRFGISVRLSTGAVVENQRATTLFLGESTLPSGYYHVANDIDEGNNNRTDIAFVGDETWGSTEATALAMADVALHEAGHTWGLWHLASGSDLETMGFRYNNPSGTWIQNTTFIDRTYAAFSEGGFAHGPGPQNTVQTMLRAFPSTTAAPVGTSSVEWTPTGNLRITTNPLASDRIQLRRLLSGDIEMSVNGAIYQMNGVEEIRVHTLGDGRDTVQAANALGIRLIVDRASTPTNSDIKQPTDPIFDPEGPGCFCAGCRQLSARAMARQATSAELRTDVSTISITEVDDNEDDTPLPSTPIAVSGSAPPRQNDFIPLDDVPMTADQPPSTIMPESDETSDGIDGIDLSAPLTHG